MNRTTFWPPRKRTAWVGAAAGAVAVAAAISIGIALTTDTGSAPTPTVQVGSAGKIQNPVADATPSARTDAIATRVQIPAIGVDSPLIGLNLKPGTDQLEAPSDFNVAGWYSNGTVPGDVGPAVIDGHVDSPTAPGIFLHLSQIQPGDQIIVTLSNGAVKTFVVTDKMAAPKAAFPTAAVYGPTPTAQLRVITCDGIFDDATGHYLDNLVVFASLQS